MNGMTRIGILLLALTLSCSRQPEAGNAILVVVPYRVAGTWVIDDPSRGLKREPFVAGIPQMIDRMTADIPNADTGFRLLFSSHPFPGHTLTLTWKREAANGNWYYSEEFKTEGWLCPALLKFFPSAPKAIYLKAEPIENGAPNNSSQATGVPAPER